MRGHGRRVCVCVQGCEMMLERRSNDIPNNDIPKALHAGPLDTGLQMPVPIVEQWSLPQHQCLCNKASLCALTATTFALVG